MTTLELSGILSIITTGSCVFKAIYPYLFRTTSPVVPVVLWELTNKRLLMFELLPEMVTLAVAVTLIVPAFPCPEVEAVSSAPSRNEKEPESIVMLPLLPCVPVPTLLRIPLPKSFFSPAISTDPVTFTLIFPASPCPAGWVSDASRVAVCS